jgi:hypothetical protein
MKMHCAYAAKSTLKISIAYQIEKKGEDRKATGEGTWTLCRWTTPSGGWSEGGEGNGLIISFNLSPEGATLRSTYLCYENLVKPSFLTDEINLHTFHKLYLNSEVIITLIRYRNAILSFCNHLIHGTILFGEM